MFILSQYFGQGAAAAQHFPELMTCRSGQSYAYQIIGAQPMDKSNRQFLHEFIAGNVGGIVGISVVIFNVYSLRCDTFYEFNYTCKVYPLDTLKTRLQVTDC